MWEHTTEKSDTHDVKVISKYTDGIFSTTYEYHLNHVDFYGTLEQHIEYHLSQPTLYGTAREIMVRDVENLKLQNS